jgi:hypothetical protein
MVVIETNIACTKVVRLEIGCGQGIGTSGIGKTFVSEMCLEYVLRVIWSVPITDPDTGSTNPDFTYAARWKYTM